jgi:hypothetical protein
MTNSTRFRICRGGKQQVFVVQDLDIISGGGVIWGKGKKGGREER